MNEISRILMIIIKIIIKLFAYYLYGWIASGVLNYRSTKLLNFIVGFIGEVISAIFFIIIVRFIELLKITILSEMLLLSSIVIAWILPILGSILVLYIYKSKRKDNQNNSNYE